MHTGINRIPNCIDYLEFLLCNILCIPTLFYFLYIFDYKIYVYYYGNKW